VRPLPHHDIPLLVLDLRQQVAQQADFLLQGVGGRFGFGDVDDAVDVEGDFFGGGGPVLVGEAIGVFAVEGRGEGVVAGGDGGFVEVVFVVGVGDL